MTAPIRVPQTIDSSNPIFVSSGFWAPTSYNQSASDFAAALLNRTASVEYHVWVRVPEVSIQLEIEPVPEADFETQLLESIERVRRNHTETFEKLANR